MGISTVTFFIPSDIQTNLIAGVYERAGGIIRDAKTKQIIAWLNEIYPPPLLDRILPWLSPGLGALNLGVGVAGFAVTIAKLDNIEHRLKDMQTTIEVQGRKLDLTFYAKARSALEIAHNAATMANLTNREASVFHAIAMLAEARHQQLGLADIEIDAKSQAADEHLSIAALLALAEARCYLEIEELDSACRVLNQAAVTLRLRVERHLHTLLTKHPVIYLHPKLKDHISLRRLTKVLCWLEPKLDTDAVFEQQRDDLFALSQQSKAWLGSLPAAILEAKPQEHLAKQLMQQPGKLIGMIKGTPGSNAASKDAQLFGSLVTAMDLMEGMIEDMQRFETYKLEVQTIQHVGMSFREWRQLAPPTLPLSNTDTVEIQEQPSDGLMYIILDTPLAVE